MSIFPVIPINRSKPKMNQFFTFLLFGVVITFVNSATVSDISSSTVSNQPKEPTVPELIASKLPAALKKHQMNSTSRLVDLKPAAATITNLTQCYEKGIVGKDADLNIFEGTIEESVYYYFSKLPSVINVQNAESRIGHLIHSMLLITDEVIDCVRLDKRDPIGLTPLSCLPVEEQTSMLG